jgi:ribosomal protein S12 methylthiotransferase accessory factor
MFVNTSTETDDDRGCVHPAEPRHRRAREGSAPRPEDRSGHPAIRIQDRTYAMQKGYLAGTHRTRSPAKTLAAYLPLAPRMGITRVANLTGLDQIGLPVYTAIRPNSRSLATSQGKGLDAAAARASALMESIESWHAEHIRRPLHWDSYLALRSYAAVVDVTALPRRQESHLPLDLPMLWIEGYDLLQQRPTWVPYEVVSLNFVQPKGGSSLFYRSSNGLASGNHVLEAIVHGLCEVIERDAEALWRLNDDFRLLDLDTVDDPGCRQTIEQIQRAGVRVAAWDMTTDTGIPAYGALVLERPSQPNWRGIGVAYGFGSHLAPEIALLRALTEAVQTRVTFIAGSRDDFYRHDYAQAADEELLAGIEAEITSRRGELIPFASRQSLASDSFEQDVGILLQALSGVGIESSVVVDLIKPEFGIPVVKVVVPGLEGPCIHQLGRGTRVVAQRKGAA